MQERSYQEVRDWLFDCLHTTSGKKVAYNHKVSTHIGPGAEQLYAYLDIINNYPEFKKDGLTLVSGNVLPSFNVENLLGAVFDDYKSRDWRIYYA